MHSMVDAAPRTVRLSLAYTEHDVDAIAEKVGFPVTESDAAAILDHVNRELYSVARAGAVAAVDARIADLVRTVRDAHVAPRSAPSPDSPWPRQLSRC